VRAAQAVGYQGAGTVEFIADASEGLRGDRIYFMEMNTRLQVEHPVTEMITGQDLVEWQLRVASGEPLPLRQDQLSINGHAMEARLYAENPATGFLPSTGKLEHFVLPEPTGDGFEHLDRSRPSGDVLIRVDSAVEQGGEVSVFYDPMIAKVITHAATREAAASALAAACKSVEVWPVRTNAAFLARCLDHPDFLAGEVDTGFIPGRLDALVASPAPPAKVIAGAAAMIAETACALVGSEPWSPWGSGRTTGAVGFRLNATPRAQVGLSHAGATTQHALSTSVQHDHGPYEWEVHVEGRSIKASATPGAVVRVGHEVLSSSDWRSRDQPFALFKDGEAYVFSEPDYAQAHAGAASDGAVLAPMPGRIVSVDAAAGQTVSKGAKLVTLEAMKMEHGLTAPFDGVVAEVNATPGAQVSEGTVLVRMEPAAA
jgi:propionyl-CoA carboxylase alpha chain/3-methylcrotonyl-CoA carboxylase alpha subunit